MWPCVESLAEQRSRHRCVYVVRHGIKEENVVQKDNLELELLPEGLEALAEMSEFFHVHNIKFGLVLCSPFLRCRQTVAALGLKAVVEPGLSEVLGVSHGLRDGTPITDVTSALSAVAQRIQSQVEASDATPLIAVKELQVDEDLSFESSMARAYQLAQRLSDEHFANGPLMLVTHGGVGFGLIETLLTGQIPVWDRNRMPEMGSATQLQEVGGQWRVIGNVLPEQSCTGGWVVRWTRGAAIGADHTKL